MITRSVKTENSTPKNPRSCKAADSTPPLHVALPDTPNRVAPSTYERLAELLLAALESSQETAGKKHKEIRSLKSGR